MRLTEHGEDAPSLGLVGLVVLEWMRYCLTMELEGREARREGRLVVQLLIAVYDFGEEAAVSSNVGKVELVESVDDGIAVVEEGETAVGEVVHIVP